MKYLAAYALVALSGKKDINANDIKTVLGGVQAAFNDEDINRVIASCKGKPIHQLINDGAGKISGGCSAPVATGKPQKETKKEEPKKEEPKKKQQPKKKEEPKPEEEEDFGLGGGLFD